MPSDLAIQKAGAAWSTEETKHITMNEKLATEFAVILDKEFMKSQFLIEAINRLVEIYDHEAEVLSDIHDGIRNCQAALEGETF